MRLRRRDGGALVILVLLLLALLALVGGAMQLNDELPPVGPAPALSFAPPINLPAAPIKVDETMAAPVQEPAPVRPAPRKPVDVVEPLPSPPADLRAEPGPAGEVVLAWKPGANHHPSLGYQVRRGAELVYEGGETTFVDDGVRAPTRYCWEVRVVTASEQRASVAASICATPRDVTPPTVPGGVSARLSGKDSVELTWDASTDEAGDVAYDVFEHRKRVAHLAERSWSRSGLAPGSDHCYSVRAADESQNRSAFSEKACVHVPLPPPEPPPRQVALGGAEFSATVSREKVTLAWRKVEGDVVYRVYTADGKVVGATAANTFVHSRIAGESQCFRVRALDREGRESPPSKPICVPASVAPSASISSRSP